MKSIVTTLLALVCVAGMAQTTVKGHVVNEKGESVEYVSVGIEENSVGVISDAKGSFTITIPKGRKKDLSFSHVSYLTSILPYREYASGKELTVVLMDKVVELAEVVIGKKNKPQTIAGKSLSGPVASFRGKGKQKYYISVAVVDSDAYGTLEMQSEFKSCYARSFAKGKIRKVPVCPAILVKGYEVE